MVPLTFHVTKGSQDEEFTKFTEYFDSLAAGSKRRGKAQNVWIIKPGENSNRGNGISVSSSWS